MEHAYYIRYGLMGRVGRFLAPSAALERGQSVVVQTHRGKELGEVLLPANPPSPADLSAPPNGACVLRPTTDDDVTRATQAEADRERRFQLCEQVFREGVWPFDLIDVEPLLDDRRTVVHYLGPHDLDVSGLLTMFRSAHGLDLVFEAVGRDTPEESSPSHSETTGAGCGSCGTEGTGCGSGGCGSAAQGGTGGCSECALKKWTTRGVAIPH